MIFEDSNTPKKVSSRVQQARDNWIKLGAEYMLAKERGITQVNFASTKGISVSSLRKALARYKNDILIEYQKIKHYQKAAPKAEKPVDKRKQIVNAFRSQLRTMGKEGSAAVNNKSVKWFRDTIKHTVKSKAAKRPSAGKMYAFVYDARDKDKLEYWDKFPLIIYLGDWTAQNGNRLFNGLNLHYIPPKARQEFLEELLVALNTKTFNSRSRLNINWNSVRGMRGSDLMIKSYLPKHVKGSLVEIDPREWANAIYLPTQQFMSQGKRYSARKVWSKY